MRVPACGRGPVGVCLDLNSAHTHANRGQAHRDDEASLLEVLDEGNGVLLEVGEAAVDGLGVVVRSSLLLGSLVQPLLQAVVGAGQEHHQVRGADLPGAQREGMKRDGRPRAAVRSYATFTARSRPPSGSRVSGLRSRTSEQVQVVRLQPDEGFMFLHRRTGPFLQCFRSHY